MVLKMAVLSTRVLGLLNQKKLIRGQMRNSDKTLLGLELQHEGAKTITGPLACSLRGGRAGPLNGVRVGAGPVVRPEGWAVCRDRARSPAFAPHTSEVAVAIWSFCILFIICPNCSCTQLFLVPYSFFAAQGDFVQVQALRQRVPGPRSQPVSAGM